MPQANVAGSTGPSGLFSRKASAFFSSLDSGHRCWCGRYLYEPVKGKCPCAQFMFCSQQAWMAQRADQLKEEVARLIAASDTCSLYQRIHLIDILEHLCLDHLFEEEINDVLTQLQNADMSDCDLQTVAIWFYLLRKHGYRVSPDDTYDVYGTLEDCELFTKCMESWDLAGAYGLPENMKFILEKVLETCQSIDNELAPEEKFRMAYLKNFVRPTSRIL
nr:unnamed protein product [Digitaria exilis]